MKGKNKIEILKKRVNQAFEIIQKMQKESFDSELNKIVENHKIKKVPEYKKGGLGLICDDPIEKIQTPNGSLTSIRFTFTNPKDFENGCVIDENSYKHFVESKKKAELFKEYGDMWSGYIEKFNKIMEKQAKMNRINKKLADLELTKSSILAMRDLIEKDLI